MKIIIIYSIYSTSLNSIRSCNIPYLASKRPCYTASASMLHDPDTRRGSFLNPRLSWLCATPCVRLFVYMPSFARTLAVFVPPSTFYAPSFPVRGSTSTLTPATTLKVFTLHFQLLICYRPQLIIVQQTYNIIEDTF
jgi:hypothetical protein